jgi:hypothetical protein
MVRGGAEPEDAHRADWGCEGVLPLLGTPPDKGSCRQTPLRRGPIDIAMLNELETRCLDLEATRERFSAQRKTLAPLAKDNPGQARSELRRAAERLSHVRRAFQDGFREPADRGATRGPDRGARGRGGQGEAGPGADPGSPPTTTPRTT